MENNALELLGKLRWLNLGRLRSHEYQSLQAYNEFTDSWIDLVTVLGSPGGILVSLVLTNTKCYYKRSEATLDVAKEKGVKMLSGFFGGFLRPAITRQAAGKVLTELENTLDEIQRVQSDGTERTETSGSWDGYELITPAQVFYDGFKAARDKIEPISAPEF